MVDLHRWLKRTSPHLLIAGSLAIASVSGCRSTGPSAVALEPGYPVYAAPLAEPAPYVNADEDPDSSPSDVFAGPAPPPPLPGASTGTGTGTGIQSGIGNSPTLAAPLLEDALRKAPLPDESESAEFTPVEPTRNESSQDGEANEDLRTRAGSDPLFRKNEFPGDARKIDRTTAATTDVTSDSSNQAGKPGSASTGEAKVDVLDDIFEPSLGNPEDPVPNPGSKATENFIKVELPEVDAGRAESAEPETSDETRSSAKTSALFPPTEGDPNDSLPKIRLGEAPTESGAAGDLPVTSSRSGDRRTSDQSGSADGVASLPVISPNVASLKPSTLSPTTRNAIAGTGSGKDQLASIAKPETAHSNDRPPVDSPQVVASIASPGSPAAAQVDAITVVAEVPSAANSIVFDGSGYGFVAHGKQISRVAPDGAVEAWATMNAPRGHVILPDGSHLVCDAGLRAIVKLSFDGQQTSKVAIRSDGHFLRSPNDLVVDSRGGIYFTDPGYARIRNPIGRIHYVAPDGSVNVVAQRLAFPEGIDLTPDGSTLLVVESQERQVLQFELLSPGRVGPKKIFAQLPAPADSETVGFANGLTVDNRGRVFVACGANQRIQMISPEGRLLKSFRFSGSVSGVAFRNDDFSRLFAVGSSRTGDGQVFEARIVD